MELVKGRQGFVKLPDLAAYLGIGCYAARQYAVRVGAERRVGRFLLYDVDVIKAALDAQKEAPEVKEG